MIDQIRRQGFKVYVTHKRVLREVELLIPKDKDGNPMHVSHARLKTTDRLMTRHEADKAGMSFHTHALTKGGATIVSLEKDGQMYTGIAECSKEDCFCKKTGLIKALGHAMQDYAHRN